MEGQQGKQELKRKEERLYTVVKVARNEDLTEQIGREIYFDLVNHDKVHHFRIPKQMPFYQFKEKVANEFGIPVQFQRFWMWAERQNHTYRPFRPLTSFEELQPVGQLREISDKKNEKELKLFLEVELDSDLRSIAPPEKTKEDILLFCKLYDPQKEELRYVGRLFAKLSGKPNGILTKLNQMAGFSPNQEIELFEEIKFEPCVMCEPIAKEATFRASQIGDGDIICFQKSQAGNEQSRYPDVPSFLENLPKRKGAYVKAQQEPKHIESQTIIHDAPHVTELPPSPGNLTQEQSTQVAVDLTVIGEQSEPVNLLAKSNVFPQAVTHITFLTKSSEQNERGAHEAKTTPFPSASHVVDPTSVHPHQEPNLVETAIGSSSFASFDALFADIQSLLEVETFEAASWSIDEIADAKKIVKQCLDMKLACFIQSGRTSEFKKSVSAMLTVNAFPDSMVDVITKFLDDFDQSCERYVGAEKDLREVEQKEKSIVELKTTLKQLSSKFMPIRNRADKVNREIADLERQLAERKAEKAQLQSNLEELAGKATTSRQALINAEQDLRLFRHKKEEAEKTVGDIERSWKSMKDYCFLIL